LKRRNRLSDNVTRNYTKTALVAASIAVCGSIGLRAEPSAVASLASTNMTVSSATNCPPGEFYCASLKRCEPKAAISNSSVTNLINANAKGAHIGAIQDAWDGEEAVKVVITFFTADENGNPYKRPAQTTFIIAATPDGKGKIMRQKDAL
jgi:hypothetical protein